MHRLEVHPISVVRLSMERNDKHIAKTDHSVMLLMEKNGWLNSKAWQSFGENEKKSFFDAYLICHGGHHAWPCLMFQSKNGMPNSLEMRWSKNLECVRKDMGVFSILKVCFCFLLENFYNFRTQSSIEDAFTTCCTSLHNMMLQKDGYLDEDLAPHRGGLLEECLAKKLVRRDGMLVCMGCGFVMTTKTHQPNASRAGVKYHHFLHFHLLVFPVTHKEAFKERNRRVTNALMERFTYRTSKKN